MSLSYGADELDFILGGYSTFIHLENIDVILNFKNKYVLLIDSRMDAYFSKFRFHKKWSRYKIFDDNSKKKYDFK